MSRGNRQIIGNKLTKHTFHKYTHTDRHIQFTQNACRSGNIATDAEESPALEMGLLNLYQNMNSEVKGVDMVHPSMSSTAAFDRVRCGRTK